MKKYQVIVAYDGSCYGGWQAQGRDESVAEVLQKSFYDTFKQPLQLIAASRTDVGVHAWGQVVLAITPLAMEPQQLRKVWNDNLPQTLYIRDINIGANNFHPWYNVAEKIYYYHISCMKIVPFFASYAWHVRLPIDWEKMRAALVLFEGTHDFIAFKHADDARLDTVRTIKSIKVLYLKRYNIWQIVVVGQRFLRHMIRKIVGAAVYVATHKQVDIQEICKALVTGKKNCELPTAPACGLLLRSIKYF